MAQPKGDGATVGCPACGGALKTTTEGEGRAATFALACAAKPRPCGWSFGPVPMAGLAESVAAALRGYKLALEEDARAAEARAAADEKATKRRKAA
jgi:hypothetical protein